MKRNKKGQFLKGTNGETFEGFGIWYDKKGYPSIWINNKSVKLHVYVWEREYGEKPKGHDIHHKDHNKGNYSLDNLELLSYSDHQRTHAKWIKEDGEWRRKPCRNCKRTLPLDQFYQRKGMTPSALCIYCSKTIWREEARTRGVKPKRYIVPSEHGFYECKDCEEKKPRDQFPKGKKVKSYCKKCANKRLKLWRTKNLES